MRKIIQLALPILIVIIFAFNAFAYENQPKGFRGIKWGTAIENVKGMKLIETTKDGFTKYYTRKADKMKIGEADVDIIVYGFYKRKFYIVFIEFKSSSNFVSLRKTFFRQYGLGDNDNEPSESYYWGLGLKDNDDVRIHLRYDEASDRGEIGYKYMPIFDEKQKAKEGKDDL